jgi:hypothetical protein
MVQNHSGFEIHKFSGFEIHVARESKRTIAEVNASDPLKK